MCLYNLGLKTTEYLHFTLPASFFSYELNIIVFRRKEKDPNHNNQKIGLLAALFKVFSISIVIFTRAEYPI